MKIRKPLYFDKKIRILKKINQGHSYNERVCQLSLESKHWKILKSGELKTREKKKNLYFGDFLQVLKSALKSVLFYHRVLYFKI